MGENCISIMRDRATEMHSKSTKEIIREKRSKAKVSAFQEELMKLRMKPGSRRAYVWISSSFEE